MLAKGIALCLILAISSFFETFKKDGCHLTLAR